MSRLKATLISSMLVMGVAAVSLQLFAQQPGGGRNGGGRGGFGGGPGGPGGWGGGPGGGGPGGGGPGGSLLSLLSNAAVQEELKLKEAQKVKLKSLTDQSAEQSRTIREQMNTRAANAQNGGNQGGQADANNQQQSGQNGGGGGGGGRGGRGRQMDPEAQERFALMREQMNELQNYVDNSIAKLLDKNQMARLKQIELQLGSPQNILRDDVMDKLVITEEQVAMINELRDEHRTVQRESGQARRELMKTAFESLPNRANNAQANNNNNGNNNNGNNNGGGNNGGRGGRGGNRGPAFDDPAVRDAMQKYMEKPEVKAKMEQFQTQEDRLQQQYSNSVYRVLSKRQLAIYKKMLGTPFDVSKIRGGGPGRGPWNNNQNRPPTATPTKGQTAAPVTAKAKPAANNAPDSDETATSAEKAAAEAPASSAKAKRKNSLRAARGLDDE